MILYRVTGPLFCSQRSLTIKYCTFLSMFSAKLFGDPVCFHTEFPLGPKKSICVGQKDD